MIFLNFLLFFSVAMVAHATGGNYAARTKLLDIAKNKLDSVDVTYRYGGARVEAQDCSHFIAEVYKLAGLPFRYLTSQMMIELDPSRLRQKYFLRPVRVLENEVFAAGDLILYKGHVAMIESVEDPVNGVGSVIHVTGGKDLRGPGLGLQRERHVVFFNFRGPLLRVLRHIAVGDPPRYEPQSSSNTHLRLHKIEPR